MTDGDDALSVEWNERKLSLFAQQRCPAVIQGAATFKGVRRSAAVKFATPLAALAVRHAFRCRDSVDFLLALSLITVDERLTILVNLQPPRLLGGGCGESKPPKGSAPLVKSVVSPPLVGTGYRVDGPPKLATSAGPSSAGGLTSPPKTPKNEPYAAKMQRIIIQRNHELGRGGYGVVFRAYDKKTLEPMAVKEVSFDEQNVGMMRALRAEFETLSKLNHMHIVRVFNFSVEENKKARIFMELMPNGSVRSMTKQLGGRLEEQAARRVMHQALLGLQYLHSQGIIHRDIKPDNMLIDSDGVIKLSDFGTCKATIHAATGTTTAVVGTVSYMAPESITGHYSQGSDIWALAATFIELVSGEMPWAELGIKQNIALLFHIGSVRPPNHRPKLPVDLMSPAAVAMVTWCLQYDPKTRPSAKELLDCPYFAEDPLQEEDGSMGSSDSFASLPPEAAVVQNA